MLFYVWSAQHTQKFNFIHIDTYITPATPTHTLIKHRYEHCIIMQLSNQHGIHKHALA